MGSFGPTLQTVAIIALIVTNVAVLLRFYTRIFIQRKFAADDWLILFSQLNFIGFMICVLNEVSNGIGNHLVEILETNPEGLVIGMKWWYIAQSFYIFATCTVKVAIILFFCSLRPSRALRNTAISMAVLSASAGLVAEGYEIFQCAPISYFWTRVTFTTKGSCLDPHKSFILLQTTNAIDVLTDVVLACLPCIMVWNMKMSRVKKLGIAVLLGMGALSAVSPFVRAFYFRTMLFDTTDFTYSAWPVTITSTTEPAIAITVVCCAQLRPLMRKVLPEQWFSVDGSDGPQKSPHPATFGAGDKRVKRRTYDTTILQDTFVMSGIHTVSTTGNEASGRNSNETGSEIGLNAEKGHPVHEQSEMV